jgi:hypothetical protein
MEKLSILAAIFALPAIAFMLIAKINGHNKWLAWICIKLPSLISLVALIVMAMSHFGIVKLA